MEPFSVPGVASTASIAANRFSTASSERRARRSRLLLQCLRQVGGALAEFVEQSRVLDGNDGFGGEVCE